MNRFLTYLALIILGVLSLANSLGRAAGARAGNTGAPGDQFNGPLPVTCQFCHNSAAIQVALQIELLDQDQRAVTEYIPNQTYIVRVSINTLAGNPTGFGFQCIPILDRTNSDAKGLRNPESNVKIVGLSSNGRLYAEHNGISNVPQFIFEWQAPPAGSGWVTFYASGNGVNRDGSSAGDGSARTTFSLNEALVNSTRTYLNNTVRLFPNPCKDYLYIDGSDEGPFTILLFDLNGKAVGQLSGQRGERIHTEHLRSGIYSTMIFKGGSLIHSGKLVVQ
jgi:hypothetical protein